jgi:type I restriction enzyme, S subunit
MAEWPTARVGEVCDLATGGTPSRVRPEFFVGEIPWLVSGDINRGEILECEGRISEAGMRSCNARFLPKDSVMIALNGQGKTRATVAMLRIEATCNQSLVCISPKDRLSLLPEFLYANLHGRYEELRRLTSDDDKDRRGLNMGIIREIKIPLPPIPEQRRIVAILDEAFEGIATAKANAEKNLQSARDLFASQREGWLTGRSDWNEALLSDLCEVRHGFAFDGQFFATAGDFVLLTPGNFFESGGYRDRGEKQKYFVGEIPEDYVLSEGSLLVAMTEQATGLLGSPLLVPESDRFLHNQRLGLVLGKPGVAWVNDFFFHVFNLAHVRAAIHASASGVKVRHTSPGKIGAARVAFPGTEREQRDVSARLFELASECERLASVYERKVVAVDALKKSLLHQAFSGAL